MSIKFRITKYLAVSALAMLLLGACSKNNIYIDLADPNEENGNGHPSGNDSGNDNGNPSKEGTLVTFSASVEGRNITRAMSPMGKGLQSWLCAYLSNTSNIITGDPIAEGTYITSSPGVLAGNNGYKMYLSNNIYNFYAVSCNSKSGGANITLNKIISASITPPKPGAVMDLSTGIITSETTYDKAAIMGINDFTVQYTMLPVKSSLPMTLTLELLVNGESFSRTYTTPLTPPNSLLAAGNSYLFRAIIDENSLTFANVSVKEWTEVDESGNPLYPIQD